jgi:hypothetical protein
MADADVADGSRRAVGHLCKQIDAIAATLSARGDLIAGTWPLRETPEILRACPSQGIPFAPMAVHLSGATLRASDSSRTPAMTAESLTSIRELDSRLTCGVQVRLLWRPRDGGLWVAVVDTRTGETFCIRVHEDERPLDVFNHPYAYAALRHLDVNAREIEPERVMPLVA